MVNLNIEKTICNEYTAISSDFLELGLDSILDDGLLNDIPIISTISSLAKIGFNIKDRLFVKKLVHFLYETQRTSVKERTETINKLNESIDSQSKIGEKLIFIIDKSDDVKKARYIGKLFSFVLENKIGYNMFMRCADSINKSFIPDLLWFLNKRHYKFNERIETDELVNAGILKTVKAKGETKFGESTFELEYELTEIGNCLLKYLGEKTKVLETIRLTKEDKNKW